MNGLFDQFLRLDRLSTGDDAVRLEWALGIEPWMWALIVPLCFTIAGWSYARLTGGRGARVGLALTRGSLLLTLAALIAGPQLTRQTQRVERDVVAVMIDRSQSMSVADGPEGSSREEVMRKIMANAAPMFESLHARRDVRFFGFDSGAYELQREGPGIAASDPTGLRTRTGSSIRSVVDKLTGRPVAGVIVISDGRSADTVTKDTLRELESRAIPVFVVPLGDPQGLTDFAIASVEAPQSAFTRDPIPVKVSVERRGAKNEIGARVLLKDVDTGAILDEQPFPADKDVAGLTLTSRLDSPGERNWTVSVVSSGRDLSPKNDVKQLTVFAADRPVRVAYFDGYPRWEYRYLKYTLVREESIKSSVLILSTDRRYIREGTDPIAGPPTDASGWSAFDVIVIGDVRPELFSDEQLRRIRASVTERGAGLLWLGGPSATPSAWKSTPLADLIPFNAAQFEADVRGGNMWLDPVVMRPTAAVRGLGVLQLSDDPAEGWPSWLSSGELGWTLLRRAQKIERAWLKPGTEVLATASPAQTSGDESKSTPLVMTMRYGAGRVAYVGTDEIWRYRYGRGETLPGRFWIPMVRMLARESLGRSGLPAVIEASPTRTQIDRPVRISARLLDQALIESRPRSFEVEITRIGGSAAEQGVSLSLSPSDRGQEDPELSPVVTFGADQAFAEPGEYRVRPIDTLFSEIDSSVTIEVVAPDDEMREPQADHGALSEIARATGGSVIAASDLNEIENLLPNREIRILGIPEIETLWDKPVVWLLLIVLLCGEWIGRRLIKLS